MLWSRISALSWGTRRSASMVAFTKKLMKPSFTPYFAWNASWCILRSAMTVLMSISLKVVSSAATCCDCTSRSAMRRRIGLMGTTRSSRAPVGAGGAARRWRRGGAVGPARQLRALGVFLQHAAAGAGALHRGGIGARLREDALGGGHDGGGGFRRRGLFAAAFSEAPDGAVAASMTAITSPTWQNSPAATLIATSVPANGDGSSTVALSDSISARGSSRST